MPLQEFVEGDRVAYLAKKAAGFEACCGNVIKIRCLVFPRDQQVKSLVACNPDIEAVMEDSGEVMLVRQDRLNFLDGYTGKNEESPLKRRLTHPFCVVCMDADANMSFVHGNTAHLATCEACAQKFMVRHDSDTDDDDIPIYRTKCPVCRQRIDVIVKQF